MLDNIVNKVAAEDIHFDYPKRTLFLFALFLLIYETSAYIANDMIMPGMMDVVNSFNATDNWVSTSLTAFILGGASLQVFLGPISDHFGRRPVMLFGAVFFLICNILISISQSIETFIIARFFQGMGLCFISVIGYATLQEIFTEMQAIRLIGLMGNLTVLAPLAGPLIGSIVIYYFSWRVIFIIIAVCAFIALLGLWSNMPETIGVRKKDGTISNSTALDFDTIKNNYVNLFKSKQFMLGTLALAVAEIPIISWIGLSPLILIKTAHLNVLYYGLWQIPIFASAIFGNIFMRAHTVNRSLAQIITTGSLVMIGSLLAMPLLTFIFKEHYITIIIGICAYSFGLGYVTAPLNRKTLFSTLVPKGTASAIISVVTMLLIGTGNELAGYFYQDQSNFVYSLFCASSGLIYLLIYGLAERFKG